jgi:magnesium transporter
VNPSPARPDTANAAARTVCSSSPTTCEARTRLYRDGAVALEGFPVEEISDHLSEAGVIVWLDLLDPDEADLAVVGEEFGLHRLALQDATEERQRPKLDRYGTHLFLNAYSVHLDTDTGKLATTGIAAFVTETALITVRKDDRLDIDTVIDRWDQNIDLAGHGVGYLLQALLDVIVDSHFTAVQSLDGELESLEDQLFADKPADREVQRRSFELRKSLVLLRRVVLPMREVINSLLRRDLNVVDDDLEPYYQDIYDNVLRAAEWTESLRDLVTTILETNLTIQGNRMNIISKKVTSWAAIIAVPTFITGFAGMNLPYPGFAQHSGLAVVVAIMIISPVLLYFSFKHKDWL